MSIKENKDKAKGIMMLWGKLQADDQRMDLQSITMLQKLK